MFLEVGIDELVGLASSLAYNSELNAFVDNVFPDFRAIKKFDSMNDTELRTFILETAIEELIKKKKIIKKNDSKFTCCFFCAIM